MALPAFFMLGASVVRAVAPTIIKRLSSLGLRKISQKVAKESGKQIKNVTSKNIDKIKPPGTSVVPKRGTQIVKKRTDLQPSKTIRIKDPDKGMKTVKGTARSVGKNQKKITDQRKKVSTVVPKTIATLGGLGAVSGTMKDKGPKKADAATITDEQKKSQISKTKKTDTSDKRFQTGPELQSNRKTKKVETTGKKKAVFDKEQAEKRKELTKDIVSPKGTVKKKRSNIVGSKNYDAQFAYDKAKERAKDEGMSEADAKKFAKGRLSKKNFEKVTKLNKGSFVKKSKKGHTDFRMGGMFYGK